LLGSGGKLFRVNWNIPSEKLAYFLGALCSDGGLTKYTFYIAQKKDNEEMISRLKGYIWDIFGIKSKVSEVRRYLKLDACSKMFYENIGASREHGDPMYLIDEKFSWVFRDEFFWWFIGGWYDGDGSLLRKNMPQMQNIFYEIRIAVKPEYAKRRLIEEFLKKGFVFQSYEFDITLIGGKDKVDGFLSQVECAISRKKKKNIKVGTELEVISVGFDEARRFIWENHYLKSCPIAVRSYGLMFKGVLSGIATFGIVPRGLSLYASEVYRVMELKRFAIAKGMPKNSATILLSRALNLLFKDKPDLYCVITYADEFYGHEGIIYKAYGAIYVGKTRESVKMELLDGSIVDGRDFERKALRVGIKRAIPGKKKNVFVFVLRKGGLRKNILKEIEIWKKKRA
jgi:hypothetical protein